MVSEAGRTFSQVIKLLPPNPHPPEGLCPPERSASLELRQGLRSALLPPVQIHLNKPGLLSKEWGDPQSRLYSSTTRTTFVFPAAMGVSTVCSIIPLLIFR